MSDLFTVVCIEDDLDVRVLFRHAINGLGGTLIDATTAADGIVAIKNHKPQLVLLDLALPGKSGWAVVDLMHADEELKEIPVIVVTIKDQAEEQYQGRHVEWVKDYINKPFELTTLENSIRRVIDL